MARRRIAMILLAAAQMLLAWGLYSAAFAAYRHLFGGIRRDVSYGLQLNHLLYLFGALALGNAAWLLSCSSRRSGLASACCSGRHSGPMPSSACHIAACWWLG
jgi:hypothetical protein